MFLSSTENLNPNFTQLKERVDVHFINPNSLSAFIGYVYSFSLNSATAKRALA